MKTSETAHEELLERTREIDATIDVLTRQIERLSPIERDFMRRNSPTFRALLEALGK